MVGELRGALIDQAVAVAASVALFAALYLAVRPEERRELEQRVAAALRRLSGAEQRAWLRSPRAEFARRSRDLYIAQEWEQAPAPGAELA